MSSGAMSWFPGCFGGMAGAGPGRAREKSAKEVNMKKNVAVLSALLAAVALAGSLAAQQGQQGSGAGRGAMDGTGPLVDTSKVTSVTGDVVKLAGGPGQGTPTLVLTVGGKEESFVLGPWRYLAAQKFSPAAGDRLHLVLWACTSCPHGSVVAEIQNVRTGDVLKLRAADGSPVFAGPMGGRGRHRGHGAMDGTCPNPDCPYHSAR